MQIKTYKARFKNDQRKGSIPIYFVARYENEEESEIEIIVLDFKILILVWES